MKVYSINKPRIVKLFLFVSAFTFSLLTTLTFMQINTPNTVKDDSDVHTKTNNRITTEFIKVPLALSLLWSNSNVIKSGDYGDYTRNDIIADDDIDHDDYEQYYDGGEPINEIFKDKDFDIYNNTIGTIKFQSPINVSSPNPSFHIPKRIITENGLFWSQWLESRVSDGLSDKQISKFINKIRNTRVTRVEAPTWNKCGRAKNQFVVLNDGTQICARYRFPHQYLVIGEILSFYLSRMLGLRNVPSVTLVNTSDAIWSNVWENLSKEWRNDTSVAMIQWIDNLRRDRMPRLILDALINNRTITTNSVSLRELSTNQFIELMQWSDLVVFDYITGNYDRVASMQDAALKENNNNILKETIHNLVKSTRSNSIWMIDNESGLLDGYWLMYSRKNGNESKFFLNFHRSMLNTICLFRRSTIDQLKYLRSYDAPHKALIDFVLKYEPTIKRQLYYIKPDYLRYFIKHFKQRIDDVYQHFERCKNN